MEDLTDMNMDKVDLKFCQDLPKVELHAHLNCSFSAKVFQHLLERKLDTNPELKDIKINVLNIEDLDSHFQCYKSIHKVCDDEYSIYQLTYDMVHQYAEDNVKYLEIRSTPKDIPATGLTRHSYISTMIKAIGDCEKEGLDIMVKILPSIDRRHGVEIGNITVDLAKEFSDTFPNYVPGIDFSGDPTCHDAAEYIPVFNRAKNLGLKLALHLAEIPNYAETIQVLQNSPPDRIGHGTYLDQFQDLTEIVKNRKIPLELCMTSNVKSKTAASYKDHHFKFWFQLNHPQVLCADGIGVYKCTLSDEYYNAATAFNFTRCQLWNLSYQSINSTFTSSTERNMLISKWVDLKPALNV